MPNSKAHPLPRPPWTKQAPGCKASMKRKKSRHSLPSASQDIPDWLRRIESEPEKLQRAEIPEWLSDAQQPTQDSVDQFEFAEQESEPQKSDLPNWLSDIEKDAASRKIATPVRMPESDLANWLNSLDDEPGLPLTPYPHPTLFSFRRRSKPDKQVKREGTCQEKSRPARLVERCRIRKMWNERGSGIRPGQAGGKSPGLAAREQTKKNGHSLRRRRYAALAASRTMGSGREPQHPTPTSPSDWHPLEAKAGGSKTCRTPKQEAPW